MATEKKTAVKKVAESVKPVAKKVAEEVKPAVEKATKEVTKEVKPVVEKATKEVKPAVKKAVAKTTKKATEVKKTVAKKVAAPKKETKIAIQFADKQYTSEDLEKIAQDVWVYDYDRKASELTSIELYVKPEEAKVYYVFNKEIVGAFDI